MKKILAPKAIEFCIVDLDKKEKSFYIDIISMEKIDAVENAAVESTGTKEKLIAQMIVLFGGKNEDFENYDFRVLNGALDYITEQIQNPT